MDPAKEPAPEPETKEDDEEPVGNPRKKIKLEKTSSIPGKYCLVRLHQYRDGKGKLMSCTSKATFGFPDEPPEKAFVCRKHKKAEFHSLYKSEFGYAAEAMMPALMHIHKAGAGPPTLSVEGKKLSVKERQARSKDYSRGEFQGNYETVHMTPCLAMPNEFGGEQVNRDYEIERLTSENTKCHAEGTPSGSCS